MGRVRYGWAGVGCAFVLMCRRLIRFIVLLCIVERLLGVALRLLLCSGLIRQFIVNVVVNEEVGF